MARPSVNQLGAQYNGRGVNLDGAYGAQCWDWGALISQRCYGVPAKYSYGLPTGNGAAAGSFYNMPYPLKNYYKRVYNNPNDPNQLPPVNAIIFWKYSLPGSGGRGHVA